MKLTTLFRLRKPDGTDPVNIEDFNDNFDVIDEELGKRLESTGAASDMTVAFEQASARTNLKTGEKISVSFGKIMKWFADLKTVAFSGSYNDLTSKPTIPSGAAASQAVANNCTTTAAGSVLDARQGKVLMDKANQLSSELYAPVSGTGAMSIAQAVTHICENLVGRQRSARGRFACADFIGGFDIISDESGNCSGTIVSESEALSYSFFRRAGADAVLKKLGSDIKVVTQSVNYPFAGVNGEQTVDFTVDFGAVSGYTLAYAGITALDTFMSNGTIKYVQFSNLRISGSTATWSVHTARGTGYGNNGCTVQGIFIPA